MKNAITIGAVEYKLAARSARDVLDLSEYIQTLTEDEIKVRGNLLNARVITDSIKRAYRIERSALGKYSFVKRYKLWKKYKKVDTLYILDNLSIAEIYEANIAVAELDSDGIKKKVPAMENQSGEMSPGT